MKKLFLILALALPLSGVAQASTVRPADIARVKNYMLNNADASEFSDHAVSPRVLRGEAKAKYQESLESENCADFGYCPSVYALTADGFPFYLIDQSDDGGFYFWAYTRTGERILECSAGESSPLTCSK